MLSRTHQASRSLRTPHNGLIHLQSILKSTVPAGTAYLSHRETCTLDIADTQPAHSELQKDCISQSGPFCVSPWFPRRFLQNLVDCIPPPCWWVDRSYISAPGIASWWNDWDTHWHIQNHLQKLWMPHQNKMNIPDSAWIIPRGSCCRDSSSSSNSGRSGTWQRRRRRKSTIQRETAPL